MKTEKIYVKTRACIELFYTETYINIFRLGKQPSYITHLSTAKKFTLSSISWECVIKCNMLTYLLSRRVWRVSEELMHPPHYSRPSHDQLHPTYPASPSHPGHSPGARAILTPDPSHSLSFIYFHDHLKATSFRVNHVYDHVNNGGSSCVSSELNNLIFAESSYKST